MMAVMGGASLIEGKGKLLVERVSSDSVGNRRCVISEEV